MAIGTIADGETGLSARTKINLGIVAINTLLVPYTGSTQNTDLGIYKLTAKDGVFNSSLAVGLSVGTGLVHFKGGDDLAATYSLKIDNNSNQPLLYVANDGFVGAGTATRNSAYSTFSHKAKATQALGYFWADFFSPNGTTGITLKESGFFTNWVDVVGGSFGAGFGSILALDCTAGSEEAAIGGYPYAGGGSFRVQTNNGGVTSGKAFAIGSGEHLINQGPRTWYFGASLSSSNQQDKYGHIHFFKENAIDNDFKAYMTIGVNDGALSQTTIDRFKISSNGQVNINFIPNSAVGLVSGDIYYDALAANVIKYVP